MKKQLLTIMLIFAALTIRVPEIIDYSTELQYLKMEKLKQNIADNFNIPNETINEVVDFIYIECRKQNVPPKIAISIALRESRFNRFALSHKGARGIFQITWITAKHHNFDYDRLFEVEYNIQCGVSRLANIIHIENQFKIEKIVAMYGNYKRENMSTWRIRQKLYYKKFKEKYVLL